ncbi:hypothetical protein BO71DRAFT_129906 [Aspergillus ellipticus CBS 707.79]|uniref:Secreted protein n=1 Tax=Aspergillus ellipticus CBS 707.79 TaxID=1448320 RepID=A0A319DIS6_9EURO|nr:hypothetical protein BO71DRAFT_129906 [Aspergillus ellipticus CBS 707.79]
MTAFTSFFTFFILVCFSGLLRQEFSQLVDREWERTRRGTYVCTYVCIYGEPKKNSIRLALSRKRVPGVWVRWILLLSRACVWDERLTRSGVVNYVAGWVALAP